MKYFAKLIDRNELLIYILVGGFITIIDWLCFGLCTKLFSLHYEIALIIGFSIATAIHYFSNKIITFQCQSKRYALQIFIYLSVVSISLLGNMLIIGFLKNFILQNNMVARVLTSALMVLPNYLLHKHLTYNEIFDGTARNPNSSSESVPSS